MTFSKYTEYNYTFLTVYIILWATEAIFLKWQSQEWKYMELCTKTLLKWCCDITLIKLFQIDLKHKQLLDISFYIWMSSRFWNCGLIFKSFSTGAVSLWKYDPHLFSSKHRKALTEFPCVSISSSHRKSLYLDTIYVSYMFPGHHIGPSEYSIYVY